MPGSHWRHHYPLFSIPTGHMNSHICTYTGVLCVSTDCKVPQRVFFFLFPVSCLQQFYELWQGLMLILAVYIYWIPMVAWTRGCCKTSLNHLLLKKRKKEKKKKSWYVMKWEKQQRRKAGWLNRKEAFLTDLRNETTHFRTIKPRLGSKKKKKKRKGLWPKTFIFHSYSSPELCCWMARLETWNH